MHPTKTHRKSGPRASVAAAQWSRFDHKHQHISTLWRATIAQRAPCNSAQWSLHADSGLITAERVCIRSKRHATNASGAHLGL